jgi:hypothetical protein
MLSGSDQTIGILRDTARVLRSPVSSLGDEVKAIDLAEKTLAVAKAERLAQMDTTKAHEADGASSITTWARREIHQDAHVTRAQVKAAATLCELPCVGEAARAGKLALRHVESFTYALAHIENDDIRAREADMVAVAITSAPNDFHQRVRHLRYRLDPDSLDKAYLDGMDKRDIRLAKTIGGWHLTGFLDIETGAKFDTILRSLSVPRVEGDVRTPAQRRMDSLEQLLTSTLQYGLPSDNGIRPHLFITATAETLQAIANPVDAVDGSIEPAILHGFGPIGPVLLAALLGDAEVTPILIKDIEPHTEVLDVGRSKRFATPRQTKAIWLRQGGVCASDGCAHPIGHIHHETWWSAGGHTDVDDMTGRCSKCHALIHAGRLTRRRTG